MKSITDPDSIAKYLTDESNSFHADPAKIRALYLPETKEEAREVIQEANRSRTSCTISGGGTGITGSRVPMEGGMILSTERLRKAAGDPSWEAQVLQHVQGEIRILVNRDKKFVQVAGGVPLDLFSQALPPDFFFPPDPTEQGAFMGGSIAANASGARSFFYGATRRWIQSLEMVLANGDLLTLERGRIFADANRHISFCSDSGRTYDFNLPSFDSIPIKNAAGLFVRPGMDLIDLLIGSEGIFGVVTQATLKLAEKPSGFLGNITFFDTAANALRYVEELRQNKEKNILSIEYFDGYSLSFMREKYPNVGKGMQAAVFTEMSDPTEEAMEWLAALGEKHGSKEDWFADSPREIQKLKEFRHALPEGVNSYLKQRQSSKLGTDFVVPLSSFKEMFEAYCMAGEEFKGKFPRDGVHFVLFGHIGDCHLHFNFITHDKEEMACAKKLYLMMAQKAVALGGTISGEHGVGKKRVELDGKSVPYLQIMVGEKGLREIAAIKKVFDPNLILNAGNVIG